MQGVKWSAYNVIEAVEAEFYGGSDFELELAVDIKEGAIIDDIELNDSDVMQAIYGDDRKAINDDKDEILDGIINVIDGVQVELSRLEERLDKIKEAYTELERFKEVQCEIFNEWFVNNYDTHI